MRTKKKLFNRIIAWLHLWPSLIFGVFIFIVCLTGTVIVYGDEIIEWSAGNAKYVDVIENKRISSDEIIRKLNKKYPGYIVSEFVFYKDAQRTTRLRVYNIKERKLAMVYINPYNGKILKKDHTIFFFFIIAHLHATLLIGKTGNWIVLITTVLFIIGCVTGLILWWPKRWNKAAKRASFTIKWKAKFKKLNYDLHNVLGFYSLIPSLFLAITGVLIFSPFLMDKTIQSVIYNGQSLKYVLPKADTTKVSQNIVPIAYKILNNEKDKQEINVWNPDFQKIGAYIFTTGKIGLKSVENATFTVYNRYTGKKIKNIKPNTAFEKVKNIIWQLHLGQWFGQFGKFITFLTGVITTSLSITGFLIWWNKRKKKR